MLAIVLQGGDWTKVYSFTPQTLARFFELPKTTLLSEILLREAVGAEEANRIVKSIRPIMPEINKHGHRRCVFIFENDCRCEEYLKDGAIVCEEHMREVDLVTRFIRSPTLRETYARFMSSNRKMQLDSEQALMRLMMTQLMEKVSGDTVPMELIAPVVQLAEKISMLTEKMAKLSTLTPEHVDNILNGVVDILKDYLTPEQLAEASERVVKLQQQSPGVPALPYEPGVQFEVDGEVKTITTTDDDGKAIQIRALQESAARIRKELAAHE